MPRKSELYDVGKKHNYLTITKRLPHSVYPSGKMRFQCECLCDCGNVIVLDNYDLTNKRHPQKSCGCKKTALTSAANTTHGHTIGGAQTRTWRCWRSARNRCFNKNTEHYATYGAVGITMCERWSSSFENFLSDMGECPSDTHTIDRFPNQSGNYEPGNCRWATKRQQSENRKASKIFTVNGVTACIAEHSRQHSLPPSRVNQRLRNGWSIEQALELIAR